MFKTFIRRRFVFLLLISPLLAQHNHNINNHLDNYTNLANLQNKSIHLQSIFEPNQERESNKPENRILRRFPYTSIVNKVSSKTSSISYSSETSFKHTDQFDDSISINWRTAFMENKSPYFADLVDMAIDSSGNIYLLNSTARLPYGKEATLIKYNSEGEVLWMKNFGSIFSDYTNPVALTLDRNQDLYICGNIYSESPTKNDVYIIYCGNEGIQLWQTIFNSEYNHVDYAKDITVNRNGDIIITGLSRDFKNEYHIFTAKYKAKQLDWAKYKQGNQIRIDSKGFCNSDNNGNYVIVHSVFTDVLIAKYANEGDELWSLSMLDILNSDVEIIRECSVDIDNKDNIYLALTIDINYIHNFVTIKLNKYGELVWKDQLSLTENGSIIWSEAYNLKYSLDGNLFVSGGKRQYGNEDYNFIVVKYDSSGNRLWICDEETELIEGSGKSIAIDKDENVYVTGHSNDFLDKPIKTSIIKLDTMGKLVWQKSRDYFFNPIGLHIINNSIILSTNVEAQYLANYAELERFDMDGVQIYRKKYIGPGMMTNYAEVMKLNHLNEIFVAGRFYDNDAESVGLLVKYNSQGKVKWIGKEQSEQSYNIVKDVSFDMFGNTYSIGSQPLITKHLSDGTVQWQKFIDEPNLYFRKLITDADGNNYVTASKSLTNGSFGFLFKYNKYGNLDWSLQFGDGNHDNFGYTPIDTQFGVDGNLIIFGNSWFIDSGRNADVGVSFCRVHRDGWVMWNNRIANNSERVDLVCSGLDMFGNVYILYRVNDFHLTNYLSLTKWNYSGQNMWEVVVKDQPEWLFRYHQMEFDAEGNAYLFGSMNSNRFNEYAELLKINPVSEIVWQMDLGQGANKIKIDRNGNSFVMFQSGMILKFDPNGKLRWTENTELHGTTDIKTIVIGDSGNIIVCAQSPENQLNSFFELLSFRQDLSDFERAQLQMDPSGFWVENNFPNPFNSITHFRYSIQNPGFVSIKVFDSAGQEVATLINGYQEAKEYIIHWSPIRASSGTYFIQIRAGEFIKTQKVVYTK